MVEETAVVVVVVAGDVETFEMIAELVLVLVACLGFETSCLNLVTAMRV